MAALKANRLTKLGVVFPAVIHGERAVTALKDFTGGLDRGHHLVIHGERAVAALKPGILEWAAKVGFREEPPMAREFLRLKTSLADR